MLQIAGGCLCGKVRYSASAEPAFIGLCHCRNCQKESGSAFAIVIGIPQNALSMQGNLKTFQDKGDSGKALFRRFCPDCGSTVMDEAEAMPGVVMVQVGTLGDPSWVKPATQIYCDSVQPWVTTGRRDAALRENAGIGVAARNDVRPLPAWIAIHPVIAGRRYTENPTKVRL